MSINRFPSYVQAADELKAALVNYVHEVKNAAPELARQADQLIQSVLTQDVVIFNQLRQLCEKKPPVSSRGSKGR